MPPAVHGLRPNIVLILADDMGFGDLGCYNPESKIPTPNIDALADRGTRWTDMHTASAVCTPSRYGLLTGNYCWRGNLPYGVLYGYEPPLIREGTPTLATALKSAGYETSCVGKWHLGMEFRAKAGEAVDFAAPLPWKGVDTELEQKIDLTAPITGGPIERGFDSFFGTAGCATAQPPFAFIEGERFVETPNEFRGRIHFTGRPGMTARGWDHAEADPAFARRAVDEIARLSSRSGPFFLYLAASAPHEPCLEATVPHFARGKSRAGARGDLVWLFDWMVGEVVSQLRKSGVAENTLVIVTSDNGALPGDRVNERTTMEGYALYDHRSCGELRGYKAHSWEGGHRVPFVLGPAVARPPRTDASDPDEDVTDLPSGGTVEGRTACLTDLFETLAAVGGAPWDGVTRDAISLLGLPGFTGWGAVPDERPRERRILVHHSGNGVYSARVEQWKLIYESEGSGGWPPPTGAPPARGSAGQLFDLLADPREQENLYSRMHDRSRELEEYLRETIGSS